ncbi:unnamed protein product [Cyprideis torosa]|uniref:Uncharacterized protein n=1 Tax=Cyprideis torosa TaxID=163714 RepID=A0A7R8ZM92_9CRUS|nr:unnamed protein product [Cyprideis torosa]CAG0888329.1 unnamed protein product [Cyprideis torosa]
MDLDLESSSYSRSFERELILSNFETFQEMDHYYKKWAEKYDSDMQKHEYNGPRKVVEKFLELDLDKDTRILDLLGGTGLVAELLKEQGYNNIDGLDGSQDMLEEAKNKGVYRDITVCYVGKGVRIPIEDETYDVLIGSGLFAPGHANPQVFPEFLRITKKGGYLLWTRRISYSELCPQLANINEEIERFEAEGKWRQIKPRERFPDYFPNADGYADVLKKC